VKFGDEGAVGISETAGIPRLESIDTGVDEDTVSVDFDPLEK
jgi:hypothetical protein